MFFFGSYERLQQTQVVNFQMDLPSLQAMNVIMPSPLHYNWFSGRVDYHLSAKNAMFLRYTHDNSLNIYWTGNQSGWIDTTNWSDQSVFGFTRVISPAIVNDFRAFYHYWHNRQLLFGSDPQDGPAGIGTGSGFGSANLSCISPVACIGNGDPAITSMIGSGTFAGVGNYSNGPQMHQLFSYEVKDNLSWQKAKHQFRFGIDVEKARTWYRPWDNCYPACVALYSAESTRALGGAFPAGSFANLPTSINSTAALNSLPIYAAPANSSANGFSVGDGTVPGFYEPNTGTSNWRFQPFVGDTWKARGNLTVNYGLEYNLETYLFPKNMPVPTYLNPILEGQTGGLAYGTGKPTATNKLDFSPVFGIAWSPGKSKKTVIRAGFGMYWDTIGQFQHESSAAAEGPSGDGRALLTASDLTNIFPNMYYNSSNGVVPLPIGAPLPLNALSTITLGDFIQILNQQTPAIYAALLAANGGIIRSGPYKYSGVAVAKQGFEIFPAKYPWMRSYQTDIGVQRELPGGIVMSADFVRKQAENVSQSQLDLNHFGRVADGLSPVIPLCTTTPDFNPNDECSSGAIGILSDVGRSVYDGLLVKVQKRLSHQYQFLASYAYQKQLTQNASQDLLNYFATYGPNLPRQNLNISGTVFLRWGVRLTLNSNITTATPGGTAVPVISGIDLNGAGNTNFELSLVEPKLLPYGCINFSCGQSQLAAAVAAFNSTYAGTKSLNGVTVPTLTLPSNYHTGAPIIDQDMRLTKEFTYKERYKFQVFGEAFNVLNIGNLTYGNLILNSSAFGHATARVGQTSTFSSGGPRAEQVGARISF